MKRETLLDYFADRIRSTSDFLVYDDGCRAYTYTYDDVRQAALAFGHRLAAAGPSGSSLCGAACSLGSSSSRSTIGPRHTC